jgi:acetylornithine deacetylase
MEETEILKKLTSFNTVSGKSNLPFASFLSKYFEEAGFKKKIIKKDNFALLFFTIGNGKEGLIISCHTDTVPPSDGWKTNPFKLTVKGEKAFGLGVCDTKGAISSVMMAVKQADFKKLNKKFGLVFTFKEETDFSGAKLLNKEILKGYNKVIVCEPSNLFPVIRHKGAVAYEVKFYGKEAHSSEPRRGIDALWAACLFSSKIYDLKRNAEKIIINKKFNPPYTTFNLAEISGGGAINKIPATAKVKFEYRPINKAEIKKYDNKIISALSETKKKIKGIRIEINKGLNLMPLEMRGNSAFLKKIKSICGKTASASYATEASIYSSLGLEAIVLGPGNILQAHKPNEYIEISQLKRATALFKKLIFV